MNYANDWRTIKMNFGRGRPILTSDLSFLFPSQARSQRCNEMKFDRQLLQRLLDTWKQMKELRRLQGYVNTSIRLIIKQFVGIVRCSSSECISP